MRTRLILLAATFTLVAAACSGGASSTPSPGDTAPPVTTQEAAGGESATATTAGSSSDTQAPSASPSATVTLETGEVFEFSIWCVLEPEKVGDTDFLFYLGSSDDPLSLDVSQFAPDTLDGEASIDIFDSTTFDTVWSAPAIFGAGEVELTLDGNTVTGSGLFFEGVDSSGPGVRGELVANC